MNGIIPHSGKSRLALYIWVLAAIWTIIVAGLLINGIGHIRQASREVALTEARANFNKDQAFRYWIADHGGVYVPVTGKTPPNPYLSHIRERDIETPSGRQLTLVNPAYMIRQMYEHFGEQFGIKGHLTSLKLLNPKNIADDWERRALEKFEQGVEEVYEFSAFEGKPYLRLMKPMIARKPCLKCHAHQGYKEGDVRGGLSISVPFGPFLAIERENVTHHIAELCALWVLGIAGLYWGGRRLIRNDRERRLAYKDLRSVRSRLEYLLVSSPAVIYSCEASGKYVATYISKNVREQMGHEPSDFVNDPDFWADHIHPDDKERVFAGLSKLFEQGCHKREYRFKKKDGTYCWIRDELNLLRDEEGNPMEIVGSWTDVTDRKAAEEKLIQSEKLASIGEISTNIAHEINNPMTAVLGYTSYLLDDMEETSPYFDDLKAVEEEALHVRGIVRNLLDFASQRETKKEETDINAVVKESILLLPQMTELPHITVDTEYGRDLPNLIIDVNHMKHVFINLINNACHAMDNGGGRLHISTGLAKGGEAIEASERGDIKTSPFVYIKFKDAGRGIPKDILSKVFEPFFSTKGEKRTGLGLSVSYGIVKNHGGEIMVESEIGKGSTFTVALPIQEQIISSGKA